MCDCGKQIIADGHNLKCGHITSCGCMKKYRAAVANNQVNQYRKDGDKYIGITRNTGNEFLIDADDFEKIKDYCWHETELGYLRTRIYKNKTCNITQMIMGSKEIIDHINGNTLDNRKCNLRIVTEHHNHYNHCKSNNNTSGFTGVHIDKRNNKYIARIGYDGKRISLGSFEKIEDAIQARIKAEEKYYGELARELMYR